MVFSPIILRALLLTVLLFLISAIVSKKNDIYTGRHCVMHIPHIGRPLLQQQQRRLKQLKQGHELDLPKLELQCFSI